MRIPLPVVLVLFCCGFVLGQVPIEEFNKLKLRVEAIEKKLNIDPPDDPVDPPIDPETIPAEWIGQPAQFSLTTPFEKGQKGILSKPIAAEPGVYTHNASIRSNSGNPAFVTFPFTCYDRNGNRIGLANRPSTGMHAVDGDWRYASGIVEFPKGTATVRAKVIKRINSNRIDVKDFVIAKGVSFLHKPAEKKPFQGTTEIDAEGNVKYLGNSIIPFLIFHDNRRDWMDYSRAGWNGTMWCSSARACQRAVDAGLIPSVSLAWYTVGGWKGNTPEEGADRLRQELRKIKRDGIVPIWFYLDNEHQWDKDSLKRVELVVAVCRAEMPKVPIYMLQGNYGTAPLYAQYKWQDITGTYVESANTGGQGVVGSHNILNLESLDGQSSPVVVGQVNQTGKGRTKEEFRNTLDRAWESGARAFGHWRNKPFDRVISSSEFLEMIRDFTELHKQR
jgi:hypothetical protein